MYPLLKKFIVTNYNKYITTTPYKLVALFLIAQLTISNQGLSYYNIFNSSELNFNRTYKKIKHNYNNSGVYSNKNVNKRPFIESLNEENNEKIKKGISKFFLNEKLTRLSTLNFNLSPQSHFICIETKSVSIPTYIKYCSLTYYS